MDACIFCQIAAGKIPCYKVYEDKDFLGFLDINPLNPGHSILIPKKHYRWVYDLENFGDYWEAAKKLALKIKKVLNPLSINFFTVGEQVAHAHIHILSRFTNDGHTDGIKLNAFKTIPKGEMLELAEKILG